MKATIDNNHFLLCPGCGWNYLHQSTVQVYFREEDAERGIYALVTRDGVTPEREQDDNPSPHRDGIRIRFWCEICEPAGTYYDLVIYQHKGWTVVEWEDEEAKR